MHSEWTFIDSKRMKSRNRINPPRKVKELVFSDHEFYEACVYWYFDTDLDLAVISNSPQLDFVSFGCSQVECDNSVVADPGLIDTAFDDVDIEIGDSFVFLGRRLLLGKNNEYLYLLHENQMYDLIPEPNKINI